MGDDSEDRSELERRAAGGRLVMDTNGAGTVVANLSFIRVASAGSVSTPPPTTIATTVVFTPSPDHTTLVSSYSVALYRASDPVTASPVATKNLGKPSPVNGEISASITDIVTPLPSGSFYAVVTAIGSGGSAQSTPSPPFTN